MSTEQPTYPPCNCRLDGTADGTCARCNNPACIHCGCFVEPARCQLCLAGPDPDVPARLQATRRLPTRKQPASGNPIPSSDTPPDPPGLVKRVFSYAEALAQWTAAGQPVRPDKEVERIFNSHCKTCKWFDPERQICRGCGCRVAETGMAVVNKIKMATENCPRELW
jgi:hypothetical protein